MGSSHPHGVCSVTTLEQIGFHLVGKSALLDSLKSGQVKDSEESFRSGYDSERHAQPQCGVCLRPRKAIG